MSKLMLKAAAAIATVITRMLNPKRSLSPKT